MKQLIAVADRVAVVGLLVLTLYGCTGPLPPDDGSGPAPTPGLEEGSASLPATPLSPYALSVSERMTIQYAEEVLTARCMQAAGFEYDVRPLAETIEAENKREAVSHSRLYGITDAEVAAKYGYDLVPEEIETEAEEPTEAYLVALVGPDTMSTSNVGGCLGSARSQLSYRMIDDQSGMTFDGGPGDLAELLKYGAYTAFSASPEWSSVVDDWSDCMAAKGWKVADPIGLEGDVLDELSHRFEDPELPVSEKEKQIALDDIACKVDTDLVRRLSEGNDAAEQQVVEERLLDLQESRQHLDEVVRLANDVVEGG